MKGRDVEIAAQVRAGFVACTVYAVTMVAAGAWLWLAPSRGGVAYALGVLCLVVTCVVLHVCGKPIAARTGYDGSMMFFIVWFFALFGVFMPVIGSVLCLVAAVWRLRGKVGGVTLTFGEHGEGGSKHYPAIQLREREGVPLGLTYVVLALGWPLVVFPLIPKELYASAG
ncbi:MAG: hypothetical protein KIT84_05375 [Labilithrix sp.]|nr:hypothetical protein [Labilithrix sp.]MCW5810418.1 hypothetical protein [Labilithrix sp.]